MYLGPSPLRVVLSLMFYRAGPLLIRWTSALVELTVWMPQACDGPSLSIASLYDAYACSNVASGTEGHLNCPNFTLLWRSKFLRWNWAAESRRHETRAFSDVEATWNDGKHGFRLYSMN